MKSVKSSLSALILCLLSGVLLSAQKEVISVQGMLGGALVGAGVIGLHKVFKHYCNYHENGLTSKEKSEDSHALPSGSTGSFKFLEPAANFVNWLTKKTSVKVTPSSKYYFSVVGRNMITGLVSSGFLILLFLATPGGRPPEFVFASTHTDPLGDVCPGFVFALLSTWLFGYSPK